MSLKAKLAEKWGLPQKSAIEIEALSHNLELFEDKEDVEREIAEIFTHGVYIARVPFLQKRILNTSPFREFCSKRRYEIHIYYITGRENSFKSARGYYNYYLNKEGALNEYRLKLSEIKEDPTVYDPYCGWGCKPHKIYIYLVDTFTNESIKWEIIKINNN